MASYLSFNFGIEIELLLASRTKNHKSWHSMATELSIRLNAAGIPNHLNEDSDPSLENYVEWSITREVTIPPQAGKGLWGLELVSPILNQETPWSTDLHQIFSVLKTSFSLTSSTHCSTHIHISTASPSLQSSPYTLASIAKSILYFEPALDSLFPAERSSSYWCQSNRLNPILKPLSMAQCFEYIDAAAACEDPFAGYIMAGVGGAASTEIVRVMNLYPARSAYGRAHGYTEDFVHGVYKWDFSNLLPASLTTDGGMAFGGGKQTLEFRQAPGSLRAEDVRTWVELAVSFVAGSVEIWTPSSSTSAVGDAAPAVGLDPARRVTMEDLWWVLRCGAQSTGIGDLRGVEKLFLSKGKGGRKGRK
ncbi:putative amidoligase enzyme-domain-containing protein [Xylariaceae sp. FL0255]|nr:putative amidoligase enzyme-domain-containing protein [Xylariaceae sp. FL0255]